MVLALALVLTLTVASAATITINRDASWNENAEEKTAVYTYYKIFDAVITEAAEVNADTGALKDDGNVVYTISGANAAEKVAALPNIFTANLADDGKYYVTLTSSTTTAATIVDELKDMVDDNPTLFPGTEVESDENPVVINVGDDGYYLIKASNGKDLAVQTIGSVTIKEKNDYPTIDKKQKKASGTYADAALPQEIGSYIDYQVTVHVPADATGAISVYDKMSDGLEFDVPEDTDGLTVTPSTATYSAITSGDDYDADATWQIKFASTVVEALRGQDIIITYRALVTEDALEDSDKENEAKLKYDDGNYVINDKTNYENYFAGIYKVDPNDDSADMSGVKFDLKVGDTAVNVTYDATNKYYVVDPTSTSNEVETKAETVGTGDAAKTYYTIKIRGLDNDKVYTLTETETKAGYNLLNGTVTLTKVKDTGDAFEEKAANTFDKVENNKGTQLPSTGGIGTTLFYIIGGLLVVGAAVVLVARRKAD